MQVILNSLAETDYFAAKLAKNIAVGDVIALQGDLGAGKTALAKCIINHLVSEPVEVTSPTFNLVQLYETPEFIIWHFDLYRLKSAGELIEIGLDEALTNGVSLIEWPEIAEHYLPKEKLVINLSCGKAEQRMLSLEGHGKWQNIL